MPIINLKGLRGLSDLNKDEQNAFIQKQISSGLLSSTSSFIDADRLYKNGEFYKKYGAELFNSMTPEERDELWKNDFINEARNRDITKESVGEDAYNKIQGLTPQGVLDLVDSGWSPDDYINTPDIATTTAIGMGLGAGIGATVGTVGGAGVGSVVTGPLGAWIGGKTGALIGSGIGLASSAIETFWNKDVSSKLDAVVAKDNERKSEVSSEILPQVSTLLTTVINGSAFKDESLQKATFPILQILTSYGVDVNKGEASNIDTLFEKVVGASTPYWEMFKDRHELSDITMGDKLDMIQKTLATDLTFSDGGYSSSSINNQALQNHISNNQSWDDWAFNTGKNLVVGTAGALGETIAGTAALGAYAIDNVNSLVGNETNYTKHILEGKDENGNNMPLLLNLSYWDGVDKFNTFDDELIKKIRENGGISPYNNVTLAGEEGRFFSWQSFNEAVKMGKYALATRLTSYILGGLSNGTSRVTTSTMRNLGASATKSETAGIFASKFGALGTYLAAGVPVSAGYGLGAYEDTKLNLTQKEDERQAKELFDNYLKTEEYESRVAKIEKDLLTPKVDDDGTIHNLYSKEDARKTAESQVQYEMGLYFSNYVKNNREALSESNPSFKENRDNIDKIAVDAYALDATIEGAKNTFVNLNFRNYLFNKSTTEMLKGGKGMTTPVRFNPRTGKIEQVSRGIGEDITSNVKVDMARAVGNQLWGGFISNYTDDITTGFVEAGAEKKYDNYLDQRYNGKATGSVASFFGNLYDVINASLQGAEAKTVDSMSWYDGFIGALGSVTPGSGGLPTLSPYNSSSSKRSFGSKLVESLIRTSGIGATAYDTYYKNRNTGIEVNTVNEILEKRKLDLLDLLDFASSTNAADISSENGIIRDAKTDKVKAFLSTLLYLDRNKENPVVTASPQLQETLRTLEIIRSKNGLNSKEGEALISNLASQFLHQNQNKDIASLPEEEAINIATSRIAERLEKARKLVNSIDEVSTEYRIQNRNASPDAVGQMVTLKVMANQYRDRINEMEGELGLQSGSSISKSLSIDSILARYPTRKLVEERLAALESYERQIRGQLETIDKTRKSKDFRAKLEWRKNALRKLQDEVLVEKKLVQETLEQNFSDTETFSRILSKEEILSLDSASRAAILNFDESSKLYSPEQRQVIREILKEYNEKGINNAKELFLDIAQLKDNYENNLEVYSDNIRHPELLEVSIVDKAALFSKIANNVKLDRQSSIIRQSVDDLISNLTANGTAQDEINNSIFRLLKQKAPLDVLKYMRKREEFIDLRDVILKAEEFRRLVDDVNDTARSVKLDEAVKSNFISNVNSIIDKANTKEDILNELGKVIENSAVEASAKVPYENLLNELEQLWGQRASTTSMTREERKAAQEEHERKLAEEEQRKKDAEEAARAEAEKRVVEESLTEATSSEEDKRLSSEKDTIESSLEGTSKEEDNRLSSERKTIENNPDALKDATDVQLESPTLDEQAAAEPNKVDIRPILTDDSTDQGNTLSESSDNLLGNSMYGYEIEPLKFHGKQVPRKGASPTDKMSRYYNWMEEAGIKLQDIIDTELSDIMKLNPDVFLMFVKYDRNATNDDAMVDFALLTVEYTQDVASIHNDKNGGVITSNGKQYLVVGTLGFARGNRAQGDMVRSILRSGQKSWFDAHPSERFFVDTRKHTKIQNISSGRLVRQLATDAEVQIRSISELLADKDRNPKGLTMGDLKWGVQYDNRLATVNVSERNIVYKPSDSESNLGATFLLIEASNGNYLPAYIRPVRLSELRDGKLKTQLSDFINELTSTEYSRRLASVKQLVQLLNLTQEGDNILIGTIEKPTLSIVRNGQIERTFNLAAEGRNEFLKYISDGYFDPRVNITTSVLSDVSSLEMFDEAGALTTDLAKLGTSGASYNVYAIDADGNPVIATPVESEAPTLEASSDLAKAQKKMSSERVGNATYRKDANGNWYTETDKLVTDPRLVEQLNYRNLIRTRGLKPDKVIGMDEVFVVNNDKDNPLVLVRRKGNQIFPMSKEGALKTINEVNTELAEKARQGRLQRELEIETSNDEALRTMSEEDKRKAVGEGSSDVNLELEETLTDEQIVKQMTGNFEEEATPQQKTAEELVEKITSDTTDIQLSEDGATYVDGGGKHYARVTSVISADEFSDGRFEADNPWGLPSFTIGTGIDEFVRDFFDNKIGNRENLASRYPNASNEQLKAFAEQLDSLKEFFNRRGLTIVPRNVTVTGTVEVRTKSGDGRVLDIAGTLDLLAYDKNGNFYIFDMKTNRSVPRGESGRKKGAKWSKQLTLYKQLLQEKYGAVVKGLEIIPIQVDYPAPKGWGNATTEYSEKGGQLYANGEEYRMAEPILHDNIPLPETALQINYSKLTPAEQAMVRTVEDVAPTRDNKAPVVQPEPVRTGEDINKTGTKSLAELQNEKTVNTAISIIKSKQFGSRARALLKAKFPDMPSKMSELERFLQSKKIATTGINNVEDWFKMIEDCK